MDVAIVGAGFGGLAMGIRLKQAGFGDFTIYEREEGVGGTWRVNTYPGAACDIPSPLYSFSFEPNPRWSHLYGRQPEILAYLEHCVARYGLRSHLRLGTSVASATFEDAGWTLTLSSGETVRARVLVGATGGLSVPAVPDLPGLDTFEGPVFHTARWDHSAALDGKAVGVLGTGASAVQVVPALAPRVGRLDVFQRTPPWIIPRPDRAIGPAEQRLYAALPWLQRLHRAALYWRHEGRWPLFGRFPWLMGLPQRLTRRFLARSVPDPALRARLTPDYTIGCKRVLLSSDYYPALQRDDVTLVTAPIEAITPRGVRTAEGHRDLDVLVLCTGFQAADLPVPFPIRGRDGADLASAWADGPEAYLGTAMTGFPNLFLLVGPNAGLGHNSIVFVIEAQVAYVLDAVRTLHREGIATLEVRPEVQARFNDAVQRRLARTVWATGGCQSWYQSRTGRITTLWPGSTVELYLRTRRLRLRDYLVGG